MKESGSGAQGRVDVEATQECERSVEVAPFPKQSLNLNKALLTNRGPSEATLRFEWPAKSLVFQDTSVKISFMCHYVGRGQMRSV